MSGYVYIRSEPGLLTVGHYDPTGKWHPDSDYDSRDEAAARVTLLNGGTVKADARLVAALRESQKELVQTLKDLGACDHSVNICYCELRRLVQRNDDLLKTL
jgi:hypothetical protein